MKHYLFDDKEIKIISRYVMDKLCHTRYVYVEGVVKHIGIIFDRPECREVVFENLYIKETPNYKQLIIYNKTNIYTVKYITTNKREDILHYYDDGKLMSCSLNEIVIFGISGEKIL